MTLEQPTVLKDMDEADAIALVLAWLRGEPLEKFSTSRDAWVEKGGRLLRRGTAYRLAPAPRIPPSPPWDVLDDRIEWVAFDEDGTPWGFDAEPHESGRVFLCTGGRAFDLTGVKIPRGNLPWQETLVQRPKEDV